MSDETIISTQSREGPAPSQNFIHEFIAEDIAPGGRFAGMQVHTRFPPEPNGYLHIGHCKALIIDFGSAEKFGGICNLRMDDTNPAKEDTEYVDAIQEDIHWLGFDWGDRFYYGSDYFVYRPARPAVPVHPLRRISLLLPRKKRLPPLRRTNRPLPRRRSPLLPPRTVLPKAPAAPPRWKSQSPLRPPLRKKSPSLLRRAVPPPRWKSLLLLSRSTRLPPRKMNRQPLKRKSPRPPRPRPAPARKLPTKGTFRARAA